MIMFDHDHFPDTSPIFGHVGQIHIQLMVMEVFNMSSTLTQRRRLWSTSRDAQVWSHHHTMQHRKIIGISEGYHQTWGMRKQWNSISLSWLMAVKAIELSTITITFVCWLVRLKWGFENHPWVVIYKHQQGDSSTNTSCLMISCRFFRCLVS